MKIIRLISIAVFFVLHSNISAVSSNCLSLGDTTSSNINNNILFFSPTQLFVNELRLQLDIKNGENKYRILGLGLSGDYETTGLNSILADNHWGVNIFYGEKFFYRNRKYWSYVIFGKYGKLKNVELYPTTINEFLFWGTLSFFGITYFPENDDLRDYYIDKFVLGAKITTGTQTSDKFKIISNFYIGVGARLRMFYDSKATIDMKKYMFFPTVTFHLGYSIGYNFIKK